METFALAAVSLTIAISIFLKKKKTRPLVSFGVLCIVLFLQKAGAFFCGLFPASAFWKYEYQLGIIALAPAAAALGKDMLRRQRIITGRTIMAVLVGAAVTAISLFFPDLAGYELPSFISA